MGKAKNSLTKTTKFYLSFFKVGPIQRRNQAGLTSVVVVFVLVLLLTLLSIGFTKVMNRSLQSTSSNQQSTAAGYAAQSGINDAISYIKKTLLADPSANVSATKCDDLLKQGAPLASASKLDDATNYTCLLIDPTPTSLFYQDLPPYKSQIVKITTSAPLSSLLFSWQSTNAEHNQFVPNADGQTLFDETVWSNSKYSPVLRVTLYPIPANADISGVQAASKTFYLYPQTGGGSNSVSYNSASGLQSVNCVSKNLGGFSGSADYDCNVVINELPSGATAAYFYARFSPYYDKAVVKIKGNDGAAQPVKFVNVQSVIDVTAKSGNATKRLQARMDSSTTTGGGDFNIDPSSNLAPEYALQTNDTLCKRLLVPSSPASPVTIESGSFANCGLSLGSENVPACRDGKDNDGDGHIDMADPGCSDPNDTDEYNDPGCQTNCDGGGGGGGEDNNAPQGGGGDLVCTVYNWQNRWGDCTNSQFGGEFRDLPNGCTALIGTSSRVIGFQVDPNTPACNGITAENVNNELAKQPGNLASYCQPGFYNRATDPARTGVECVPVNSVSCAPLYQGSPQPPDYSPTGPGCTKIEQGTSTGTGGFSGDPGGGGSGSVPAPLDLCAIFGCWDPLPPEPIPQPAPPPFYPPPPIIPVPCGLMQLPNFDVFGFGVNYFGRVICE